MKDFIQVYLEHLEKLQKLDKYEIKYERRICENIIDIKNFKLE